MPHADMPVHFVTRDGIPPAVAALAEIKHYLMRGDSAVLEAVDKFFSSVD